MKQLLGKAVNNLTAGTHHHGNNEWKDRWRHIQTSEETQVITYPRKDSHPRSRHPDIFPRTRSSLIGQHRRTCDITHTHARTYFPTVSLHVFCTICLPIQPPSCLSACHSAAIPVIFLPISFLCSSVSLIANK